MVDTLIHWYCNIIFQNLINVMLMRDSHWLQRGRSRNGHKCPSPGRPRWGHPCADIRSPWRTSSTGTSPCPRQEHPKLKRTSWAGTSGPPWDVRCVCSPPQHPRPCVRFYFCPFVHWALFKFSTSNSRYRVSASTQNVDNFLNTFWPPLHFVSANIPHK